MALTKDQQFSSILWFLLKNGEDFRILFEGKLYENVGDWIFCDGELLHDFLKDEGL